MVNLCCVVNPKLICFDCRTYICAGCSWIGKLRERPDIKPIQGAGGLHILCRGCLDTAQPFVKEPFTIVSTWKN